MSGDISKHVSAEQFYPSFFVIAELVAVLDANKYIVVVI